MAVTPQIRAGSAANTVRAAHLEGLPKSTRKRQATGSDYERARIEEISRRAELYELKLKELKANLLDRTEVLTAFSEITSAIKEVIAQSPLSRA